MAQIAEADLMYLRALAWAADFLAGPTRTFSVAITYQIILYTYMNE
jgi:hypothetical protein